MDMGGLTPEIQNYINAIQEKRSQSKWLSFDVCQQMLKYAAETKSDVLFGLGYYYLAENYWFHEDNENTMQYLTEGAKYLRAASMYEYLARAYNMMGAVSDRKSNRMIALDYYYVGLQYAEKYHFYYVQAMAENNIAFSLLRMRRHKEAIERYYNAIECYQKSEETYHRKGNQLICMIECGLCHMFLGELDETFVLEQKIRKMLCDYPDVKCSPESVKLYYACCETIRGNKVKSEELLDEMIEELKKDAVLEGFINNFVILVAFLDSLQDDDRLGRLMDIVSQAKLKKHLVYLDLYPFISRYMLRKNQTAEYMKYTKEYFSLYERHEQENRQVAVMMLELRDKLKRVEKEQNNIREHNKQLEKIAMYDSMTGLANRTYLNEYLSKQFDQAFLQKQLLGVELLDKQYNDTYGHLAGDKCIEAIADVLHSVQNERIFCARYGGDEFMLIYSGMELEEIRQTAKIIQEKVRSLAIPHIFNHNAKHVTVSQGIFVRTPKEENREWDYNAMADEALYEAKKVGRNCFCVRTEF